MFFRPRLKKLQFSLRAFLAICILLGGYLAIAIPRAHQQKRAADWIRSFGRTPYYSYQFAPSSLGIDLFYSIHFAFLTDKPVLDVSNLGQLEGLKHLELDSCGLSHISPLAKLTRLEVLSLNNNTIFDLRPLRNSRSLHDLSASGTQISEIAILASLPRLRSLDVSDTLVTDLTPLQKSSTLVTLDVSRTRVKSLLPLRSIKTLTTLIVRDVLITEEEIAILQEEIPNLKIQRENQ